MRENIHIIVTQIFVLAVVALGYWALQLFGVLDTLSTNGWEFYFWMIFIFVGVIVWYRIKHKDKEN